MNHEHRSYLGGLVYKGNWFYETQILMLIIMWRFDKEKSYSSVGKMVIGDLAIRIDTAWKWNDILPRAWKRRLNKAGQRLGWKKEHLQDSINDIKRKFDTLRHFFTLYSDGFEITMADYRKDGVDADPSLYIFRFWWNGEPLDRFPDIDLVIFDNGKKKYTEMMDGKGNVLK